MWLKENARKTTNLFMFVALLLRNFKWTGYSFGVITPPPSSADSTTNFQGLDEISCKMIVESSCLHQQCIWMKLDLWVRERRDWPCKFLGNFLLIGWCSFMKIWPAHMWVRNCYNGRGRIRGKRDIVKGGEKNEKLSRYDDVILAAVWSQSAPVRFHDLIFKYGKPPNSPLMKFLNKPLQTSRFEHGLSVTFCFCLFQVNSFKLDDPGQ